MAGVGSPQVGTATITLDLGGLADIGEIKFGRDRLGTFSDRAPNSLTLELAGLDGIYQNMLTNASIPAGLVSTAGYTLSVRGFDPNLTRYVRMSLTSAGAAFGIDEIEIMAAPAPGTVALFGLGLLGLARFRRRTATR